MNQLDENYLLNKIKKRKSIVLNNKMISGQLLLLLQFKFAFIHHQHLHI